MADMNQNQPGLVNKVDDNEELGLDPKTLAESLKKSRKNVEALEQLSNDPKYQDVPTSNKQELKDAISNARQLYDERSSNNDWLEVAQSLGQAVARFAGASAGLHSSNPRGADMSNLALGPGVDYNSRNDRAFKDYQESAKQAGNLADVSRQEDLDKYKVNQDELARKANAYKEGANIYDTQAKTISSDLAAAERSRVSEANANSRFNRQLGNDNKRQSVQDKRLDFEAGKLELKNTLDEGKSLDKQLTAARQLQNNLLQEPDVSKKNLDKLQEKYGALAAQAGIDLKDAMNNYEANTPKRKRKVPFTDIEIPGTETADETQAPKTLAASLGLDEKIKSLQENKAKQKAILDNLKGGSQPQPSVQSSNTPAAPANDRIKVKDKDGKMFSLPKSQLQDALNQGFTEIK